MQAKNSIRTVMNASQNLFLAALTIEEREERVHVASMNPVPPITSKDRSYNLDILYERFTYRLLWNALNL